MILDFTQLKLSSLGMVYMPLLTNPEKKKGAVHSSRFSGNSQIIEARLSDFKITRRYAVGPELAGMIQIMPVDGGYYITVSTDVHGNQDFATIIFAESLKGLADGKYTDIYSYFIGGGTPYYMGNIDGTYYLTEHRLPGHSIWSFDIGEDHMPANVKAIY